MKTWPACLMIAMLLGFQLEAKAQRPASAESGIAQSGDEAKKSASQEAKFVYLELDDVFAEAASRETNNRISTAESQQFGRNVESQLATSRRLEPEAARLLLELQANPNAEAVIENASTAELRPERKLARADIFIAAYTLALIKSNEPDEPQGAAAGRPDRVRLLDFARKELLDSNVQQALLAYTQKELGDTPDPETKTIELSVSLRAVLTPEMQSKMSLAIKAGDTAALLELDLPPPLCIIFNCCK